MRPCRICPTCKRAIAIQTNGTFYQHRDRWAGTPRPVCKWSGLEPPEGKDPMPEPRSTRVEQLRAELAAATARAELLDAEALRLRRDADQANAQRNEWRTEAQQQRARAEQAEAALETLRGQLGKPRETGDERDRAVWCWTPNPHGRLHCGRLAGHDGPHKRGEREWREAEEGGEPT